MTPIRNAMRDVAREILAAVPPPQLAALCDRVPEVRELRNRIDATDFPTPQECADARYYLATGGRRFDLVAQALGFSDDQQRGRT